MIIWTYTSISKALQGRKLGELEVNFGNKLGKFHRFLRSFDKFCENPTKWGTSHVKVPHSWLWLWFEDFSPTYLQLLSNIFLPAHLFRPTRLLDLPKNILPTRLFGTTRLLIFQNFPSYTFIWHYTSIWNTRVTARLKVLELVKPKKQNVTILETGFLELSQL